MFVQKYLGIPFKQFLQEIFHAVNEDDIFDGAAALSYYLLFSLFPAMIFLLSVLPYLPIENLNLAIMNFMSQALPGESAKLFSGVVTEVTSNRSAGLLSFGAVATIWTSSTGLYAIMQQLNKIYDVKEERPFWKARGVAILLTLVFGVIIIGAFALIVFGGVLQNYLISHFGYESLILSFFRVFRWVIIGLLLLLGFSVIYYYGPNVEQKFKLITPGSLIGTVLLVLAAVGFRYYVDHFGNYAATYGSIGAVIILMLFLYISGLVILFGSEVNAIVEHHHPVGKNKNLHTRKEEQGGTWIHSHAGQDPV